MPQIPKAAQTLKTLKLKWILTKTNTGAHTHTEYLFEVVDLLDVAALG